MRGLSAAAREAEAEYKFRLEILHRQEESRSVTDGGVTVTFRTVHLAREARTLLRQRPEGDTCPRLIRCGCRKGGGALQAVWGHAPYCESCGSLL